MRSRKRWIMASLICVASGILILCAGKMLGGRPGFYIDSSGIHSPHETADTWTVQEKGRELEPFERMEIDVDYADIEISLSDRFAVEYYLEGEYKEMICQVKNGTFTFREAGHVFAMNFGFFADTTGIAGNEPGYYVKIEIPRDAKLSSVSLHTESGDITAELLKAGRLEIDNDYGDISLHGFEGEELEIGMESGDLRIDALKSDRTEIENEYGSVAATAADGIKAYDLELDTEYGSIRAGDETIVQDDYSEEAHYTVKGEGQKKMKIYCEYGDIEVW